jgi:hypothetical protein
MKLKSAFFVLAFAAVAVGCGGGEDTTSSPYLLASGKSNKVSTGGYWFTYADTIGTPSNATAKALTSTADWPSTVLPVSSQTVSLVTKDPTTLSTALPAPPAAANVGSKAICFDYHVPIAPTWTLGGLADFPYKNTAGDMAAPVVGVGFNFKDKNVPFDLTAKTISGTTGVAGIKFWAAASDTTKPFAVKFPDTAHTAPESADQFTTTCTCSGNRNSNYAADEAGTNIFCEPVGAVEKSYKTGENNANLKTCYGPWRYNIQPSDTEWHQYVVKTADLVGGDIIAADNTTAPPSLWVDRTVAFKPKEALQVLFEMYQPKPDITGDVAGNGSFCVADVEFVMEGDTSTSGLQQ